METIKRHFIAFKRLLTISIGKKAEKQKGMDILVKFVLGKEQHIGNIDGDIRQIHSNMLQLRNTTAANYCHLMTFFHIEKDFTRQIMLTNMPN